MTSPSLISRLLARMSVSRKLMLIYLLDLSAVVFITTVLVQEQFVAINFARHEVQGNRYLDAVRDDLLAISRSDGAPLALDDVPARLAATEKAWGEGMQSAQLQQQLAASFKALDAAPPQERIAAVKAVLTNGRLLYTRVGNQSNLILDPDLDSYYTMSLVVLRFPELLELAHSAVSRPDEAAAAPAQLSDRSQYLMLAGQLDALRVGIDNDINEAIAAGGPALAAKLALTGEPLRAALNNFRLQVAALASQAADADAALQLQNLRAAHTRLLSELQPAWARASQALDELLHARISGLFQRMGQRLASALAMLAAILLMVVVVARHITLPLKQLTGVADAVRRSGDHSKRATWRSSDELGQLVLGFNDMLAKLEQEREVQKERAASERAASTQRALVAALPVPMVVTAFDTQELLHANERGLSWLAGRHSDIWDLCLEPEASQRLLAELQDHEAATEFDVRWLGGDTPVWTVLSARRLQYQGQEAVMAAFAPMDRMQLMERSLDLWGKVFEASSEGILILDAQHRIVTANRGFVRLSGHALDSLVGTDPAKLIVPGTLRGGEAAMWEAAAQTGNWQGEVQALRLDGSAYPAWLMISAVGTSAFEPAQHYIATFIDISERKQSEERIRFLAEHDALTELPNRLACTERLRLALQLAQRHGQKVAVLFIDLDNFKSINDTLGHHVGDGLLRQIASSLSKAVRAGDTVSRQGGDEFVIVLGGLQDIDELTQIVDQRLVPHLRQVRDVDGVALRVSCSVGIAVYPEDATDADTLMRHADTAMYQVKADGRDAVRFFNADMTVRAQARRLLETDLRQALESNQLSLYWQPRLDAQTERMVGVEGLLRWKHPVRGMVPPDQFISLAEETGLIVPIGAWVIGEACRQIAEWRQAGVRPFGVSVNLSARQLRDNDLIQIVQGSMQAHGIGRGVLELELTESMVMDGAERNLRQLHALRDLGVSLSIDDFGTGYSSLAYLSRFPIDKLKVDRSFVLEMLNDDTGRAITMAVIGLGHTLGLKVVAEGVEEPRMAQLLREARCDELQGFLFARPMPAPGLLQWLAEREPRALTASPAQPPLGEPRSLSSENLSAIV